MKLLHWVLLIYAASTGPAAQLEWVFLTLAYEYEIVLDLANDFTSQVGDGPEDF